MFLSYAEDESGSDFADTLSDTFSMSSDTSLSDDTHSCNDTSHDVDKGCFSDESESEQTAHSDYVRSDENQRKNISMVIGQIAMSYKAKKGRRNEQKIKLFKILLDSGATGNSMSSRLVSKNNKTTLSNVAHATANGNFNTSVEGDLTA